MGFRAGASTSITGNGDIVRYNVGTTSAYTNITINDAGESTETRPINAYVHWIIKH